MVEVFRYIILLKSLLSSGIEPPDPIKAKFTSWSLRTKITNVVMSVIYSRAAHFSGLHELFWLPLLHAEFCQISLQTLKKELGNCTKSLALPEFGNSDQITVYQCWQFHMILQRICHPKSWQNRQRNLSFLLGLVYCWVKLLRQVDWYWHYTYCICIICKYHSIKILGFKLFVHSWPNAFWGSGSKKNCFTQAREQFQ